MDDGWSVYFSGNHQAGAGNERWGGYCWKLVFAEAENYVAGHCKVH